MIILFQILLIVFSVFAILNVINKKKIGLLSTSGVIFWVFFWLAVIVAASWPNSTQLLADKIGIGRGVDLVNYVALAILFFLMFRIHIKIESVGRDVTKVVRKNAIGQVPKGHSSTGKNNKTKK